MTGDISATVCQTCNDTHQMELGGAIVGCTRCPVPCQECRMGGTGPYCERTPCPCICHQMPLKLARPIIVPRR